MTTIWIVCLEPIDNRYTKQWYTHIPKVLAIDLSKRGIPWKIVTVTGQDIPDSTTLGAFLDFGQTNFYKGTQTASIAKIFSDGKVEPGDKFLVTDFWHFGITAIRYMSELLNIPIEIHSIVHAGAYDPSDILGMKMSKEWSSNQEKAWFHACDYNYFGSNFHRDLFLKNLKIPKKYHKKAIRSGQPYREVAQECGTRFDYDKKENVVVFTHRLNEDKQPKIFRNLVKHLPNEWGYVITQDNNFTKEEYYNVLGRSKIVFSCALHENLGVGMMEGTLCGCIPIVPDRASYSEIYDEQFKYPSEWTQDWKSYLKHKKKLIKFMTEKMEIFDELREDALVKQSQIIIDDFMYPGPMLEKLLTPMKIKV